MQRGLRTPALTPFWKSWKFHLRAVSGEVGQKELGLWRWAGQIHVTAQSLTSQLSQASVTSSAGGNNSIHLEVKPLALRWHMLEEMQFVAAIKNNDTFLYPTYGY